MNRGRRLWLTWLLPALVACQGGAPGVGSVPAPGAGALELFGWEGPPEARTVRRWSEESIAQAPGWTLAEQPAGVVVPDTVETPTPDGRLVQRDVKAGPVLPNGNAVLLLVGSDGTRVIVADSELQSVMDADDPDGIRHDRIPPMSPGWGHSWVESGRAYPFGQQAMLGGFVVNLDRGRRLRGPFEVLQMDPDGRFTGPPTRIAGVDGSWRGVFPDGSLLFAGPFREVPGADSVASNPFRIVRAGSAPENASGSVSQEVLFTTGLLRTPGRRLRSVPWSHNAWHTVAVSGETIWVVPSERPELLALDRSGEVLLRIEWDAGDRALPAGLSGWDGLERFPAASALVAGSDGRIHVQRFSVQNGHPVRGPEWLVFSPAGDLLGRLVIPRRLRVLAFGANTALVQGTNDEGVDEVRLHALEERR